MELLVLKGNFWVFSWYFLYLGNIDVENDEAEIDDNLNDNTLDGKFETNFIFDAEIDIDENVESLELRDFSNQIPNPTEESPYLRISVENKFIIVKKSSFCWFLDQSGGKVSTDRIRRFFSKKNETKNAKSKEPIKKRMKRQAIKRNDSFSDDEEEINIKNLVDDSIQAQKYSHLLLSRQMR